MSCENASTLLTLPIELVYRILANLEPVTIMMSAYNVCVRLNTIIDLYQPYQVESPSLFLQRCSLVMSKSIATCSSHLLHKDRARRFFVQNAFFVIYIVCSSEIVVDFTREESIRKFFRLYPTKRYC